MREHKKKKGTKKNYRNNQKTINKIATTTQLSKLL